MKKKPLKTVTITDRDSPGDLLPDTPKQKNKKSSNTTHLLGNLDGVDKVHVETIAQLDDSGCDLVKGDTLLASWNGRKCGIQLI
jgi:hypothetical protein